MDTSTIRIAIRTLPEHFDRSRIPSVVDELEAALLEESGIHARGYADSMTITLEVPTHRIVDAATTLRSLDLI
ncbi:hypothetical protein [Antarctobacter jejuensis]|uniref:hypothetical protein n=1 Tax=Antarctobacter jejuensis TaxID=1439938 RepID=UPI003FD4E717